MTESDLAAIARRRAAMAALFGTLLLAEVGEQHRALLGAVPALAGLADPAAQDEAHVEFERVMLRAVPLYQSVFTGTDERHGGPVVGEVAEALAEAGLNESPAQWRVLDADHLGLILRGYGHWCRREAEGWAAGDPVGAAEAVEGARRFAARHLAGWAPLAVDAGRRAAAGGPYATVFVLLDEWLTAQFELLRPAPRQPAADDPPPALPGHLGPRRVARLVLSPALAGYYVDAAQVARVAEAVGAPWRASDQRSLLGALLDGLDGTGEWAAAMAPLIGVLEQAAAEHRRRAGAEPGNRANHERWASCATALARRLAAHGDRATASDNVPSELLRVSADDAATLADSVERVITALRAQGLRIEPADGPPAAGKSVVRPAEHA